MRINYAKGQQVTITFGKNEMLQALTVLKAMAHYFNAQFIYDVADDLKQDMQPRIAHTNYFHLCDNCFMELDVRKDSYVEDDGFRHVSCPLLKADRPI